MEKTLNVSGNPDNVIRIRITLGGAQPYSASEDIRYPTSVNSNSFATSEALAEVCALMGTTMVADRLVT